MCGTSNQSEAPKRLSDLGEYDPATTDGSKVEIQDITDQMIGGGIQIIGGAAAHRGLTYLPPERVDALLDYALHFVHSRQFDEGLGVFAKVGAAYLDWSDRWSEPMVLKFGITLFTIGQSLRKAGKFDDALTRLGEALAVYQRLLGGTLRADALQETAWVLAEKSIIFCNRGQFDEAVTCAHGAVEALDGISGPTDEKRFKNVLIWSLRCEGHALKGLHRAAEASACYQRAAELHAQVKSGGATDHES